MRRWFESALWSSRLVVLLAVITAVLAGVALFLVIGLQTFGVLVNMFHCIDPTMAVEQRETIMSESIIRLITMIDGYLLGAFMLIFGFGLYELFLAQIQEAKASRMSARILRVESLEDLKSRLGKVILIILIVETFKDGFQIRTQSPLDVLCVAASIALIGLALYLTHSSGSEKTKAGSDMPE